MNKIFLTLLFSVSLLVFSDTLILEDSENCCKEFPIEINLISSNSVDGIAMRGVLSATTIGDMHNTITGPAKLKFSRKEDKKTFTVIAPSFGFQPPNNCINDFYDENIGNCVINSMQTIEIKKPYDFANDNDLITIDSSLLKVIQLFNFSRGYNSHDVYRIINTNDRFEAKFLYNFPETAEWNEDGSFSYHLSGGAVSGTDITVDEINGKWVDVKKVEYGCWSSGGQTYKVYEYNKDSDELLLTINESSCPN